MEAATGMFCKMSVPKNYVFVDVCFQLKLLFGFSFIFLKNSVECTFSNKFDTL